MKRRREREKGGGKEWNNEKWTQESSRDRNRQIDIISDTCRELFSARTEAGSVRESILRGEWKHLCQPTGIWLTLQKAARPLGTCLYSVGLFFLLVVFYGKNMFLRIPSSMGRENIFLVFSMPGAESWKHFSFPKKKWEKKKKATALFKSMFTVVCTSSTVICWIYRSQNKASDMPNPETLRIKASHETPSALCIDLMIEWSTDSLMYAAPISNHWGRSLFCLLHFLFFFRWPVQQRKKMMHDKLMDGDNKRFA